MEIIIIFKLKIFFFTSMSVPKKPETANLVISFMYKDYDIYEKALKILKKEFGEIKKSSQVFDFDFTNFYEKEFGKDLKKAYFIFGKIEKEHLPDIKHLCFELEMKFSVGGNRFVNIDPGYLTKNSFVLASFKERAHRIYLSKGVYADLQLVKENKEWKSFKWTFPDLVEYKEDLLL